MAIIITFISITLSDTRKMILALKEEIGIPGGYPSEKTLPRL
jgi:hypothetical protein